MARRCSLWLVPLLLLAGCSGTPLGDQLSGSFSAGSNPPASGTTTPRPPTGNNPGRASGTVTPAAPDNTSADTLPTPERNANQGPASPPRPRGPAVPARPAATPAPYRVTIKLPAADPSAPAEALTEALRSAGLSFEVETIERVGPATGSRPPATTPAPAPR